MKRSNLLVALFLSIGFSAQAQYVYPEKFEDNCYLDEFEFEKTEIIAEMDNDKIIESFTRGWSDKMLERAEGNLGMQILIDERGNACLVSIRNDTNIKSKKMNLMENVVQLKWKGQSPKISALVVLVFGKEEIEVKRLGTKDMKSLTEIKP